MPFAFNENKTKYDLTDDLSVFEEMKETFAHLKSVNKSISANNGYSYSMTGAVSALLVVTGRNSATRGIYLVHRTDDAISHTAVLAGSGIQITEEGSAHEQVRLYNGGSSLMRATYIVFSGDISIIE